MRNFTQDARVFDKSHTAARVAGIEGEEKHGESVPQARRGQKQSNLAAKLNV